MDSKNESKIISSPISVKFSMGYLLFISIFYIIMGFGTFINFINIPPFTYLANVGFVFGMLSSFVVIVPEAILSQSSYHDLPPFLPFLGIVAIVLGIVAIISLANLEEYKSWIRFWHFIFVLAFIITISNVATVLPDWELSYLLPNIINLLLLLFAILRLERWVAIRF